MLAGRLLFRMLRVSSQIQKQFQALGFWAAAGKCLVHLCAKLLPTFDTAPPAVCQRMCFHGELWHLENRLHVVAVLVGPQQELRKVLLAGCRWHQLGQDLLHGLASANPGNVRQHLASTVCWKLAPTAVVHAADLRESLLGGCWAILRLGHDGGEDKEESDNASVLRLQGVKAFDELLQGVALVGLECFGHPGKGSSNHFRNEDMPHV
mmetsp:Transcript_15676/g.37209  ORF Transcript_15676/g.37209 Transcript_15676/m.37209 type:complete len:208 (+) Transcript_15676:1315-1938(+)